MTAQEYLDIISVAAKLKTTPRHCFTAENRTESVADHSWRIAMMGMLLCGEEEFRDLDRDKLLRMCLIHDLGEAFTGDIPTFLKNDVDTQVEDTVFRRWVRSFSEPQRSEWLALLDEMEALETREARTYKALDKLEAIISHNESDISTWLPLEYELQFSYGQENMKFSPWLTGLRAAVDAWSKEKIAVEAPESEYNKRQIQIKE